MKVLAVLILCIAIVYGQSCGVAVPTTCTFTASAATLTAGTWSSDLIPSLTGASCATFNLGAPTDTYVRFAVKVNDESLFTSTLPVAYLVPQNAYATQVYNCVTYPTAGDSDEEDVVCAPYWSDEASTNGYLTTFAVNGTDPVWGAAVFEGTPAAGANYTVYYDNVSDSSDCDTTNVSDSGGDLWIWILVAVLILLVIFLIVVGIGAFMLYKKKQQQNYRIYDEA